MISVTNPCASNNGECSHLCLLSSSASRGYTCVCPDEMVLGVDGLTCSQSNLHVAYLLFVVSLTFFLVYL